MEWTAIISAAAAISGIILGWWGRAKTVKEEEKQDAAQDAQLRTTVNYIKNGIDELKAEVKARGQQYDMLAERVTRVEESSKQAHKRIDRLEHRMEGEP